jgi:hypothetical protein
MYPSVATAEKEFAEAAEKYEEAQGLYAQAYQSLRYWQSTTADSETLQEKQKKCDEMYNARDKAKETKQQKKDQLDMARAVANLSV